jgi:hypothetical protein
MPSPKLIPKVEVPKSLLDCLLICTEDQTTSAPNQIIFSFNYFHRSKLIDMSW